MNYQTLQVVRSVKQMIMVLMIGHIPAVMAQRGYSLLPDWAKKKLLELGGIKSTTPVSKLFDRWPVELYHVTFSSYLPLIMKEGLATALRKEERALQELARGKEPIEGVYLAEDWEGILETMGYAWVLNLSPGEEVVVLRVDIPNDWKVIPDPEMTSYDKASGRLYVGAVISLDPIPAGMISKHRSFTEDEVVEMRAV